MIIEIGYQDVRDHYYVAFTERAVGHVWWTFQVDHDPSVTIEAVAEAAYAADNAPFDLDGLAGKIREAMQAAYARTTDRHHSLSVGDRVRVGDREVVCADFGFKAVPHTGKAA